jgi:ELWxxDGT repeat protein
MVTSRALFAGVDAGGSTTLWITDGTAAGTHELTEAAAGPGSITLVGSKAVFVAGDSRGRIGLWVTDGTSAGTVEIIPAKSNPLGLFNAFTNPDFVALGGKLLFRGYDTKGLWSLWVTDGTLAGTRELSDKVDPGDITVFGNKAVFNGGSLWVTDGTSAGTHELKVKGGSDFTVLGRKVLFRAEDSTGQAGLWVTDGTAVGTAKLEVEGLVPGGIGPNGPEFTVLGGKALFIGSKTNGFTLWVTDGTAAGTSELVHHDIFKFVVSPHFTVLGSR